MTLNTDTFEFGQARLRLNTTLRFTARKSSDGFTYLVEDEVTGRFFRIGVPQYTFLSMLDGERTVSTALMKAATLLRENALEETEAAGLCKWAIESRLVEPEAGYSSQIAQQLERQKKQRLVSWLNPLMLKVPLGNPSAVVEVLHRYMGFLVSWPGLLIWLTVVVIGTGTLARHWRKFYQEQVVAFSADDVIWIGLIWFLLKFIHEAAHAVVGRKFGGRTHQCGVLLLLLIPMPFVDLTSSWRFDNKWKRILTSAAGMMAELFIAALCCEVWIRVNPGPLQYHVGNLILSATFVTLLFNANPLMRFDGYYIISDFLDIPNLSQHGRVWVFGKLKSLFFGISPEPLNEVGYRGLCVRIYGLFSAIWSVLIATALLFAAYGFIDGFGLLIALSAGAIWIGIPVWRVLKLAVYGGQFESPHRLRFVSTLLVMSLAVGGFLWFCPAPAVVAAPIVIDHDPFSIVRARAQGFVQSLHVAEGQSVVEGELLVGIVNPELSQQLNSIQIDIAVSKLRIDTLMVDGLVSQVQLEQESLHALQQRENELRSHLANLDIRAPAAGRVFGDDLKSLIGQWVDPGSQLLAIGNREDLIGIALVEQRDAPWVEVGASADLVIWGAGNQNFHGRIRGIEPRAGERLPHEAFGATSGGPLPVVSRKQIENGARAGDQLVLTKPRIELAITLAGKDQKQLIAGQTGRMFVRARHENILQYMRGKFLAFVRSETSRTHGL